MSDGSEKRPLTKMLWSVSIKTRTFALVNTCNGSFKSCLKLLKQYRTIEQMCSDAHSITLNVFEIKRFATFIYQITCTGMFVFCELMKCVQVFCVI